MSFREKSAWITLITLILLTAIFIAHIPPPYSLAPAPSPFMFSVLIRAVIAFVIVVTVAHVVVAIRAPKEAQAPKDERERLIGLRATAISAHVYAFLTLSSIFTIHFGANQIGVAYLVLFSFITAEIVNYGLRVFFYRRGF